jgi:multiple sugar transport system permease protein
MNSEITREATGKRPLAATRDRLLGLALIAPTVIVFSAVIVYPLVSAIYLSVFSIYTPTMEGEWVGIDNYRVLIASGEFWRSLLNNVIWTVGTLTLQVVFGIIVALVLHQNLWFRSLARSLVLFPYFLSTVVAVLVWRWLFNDLYGVLNHLLMGARIVDMPVDWLGSMPNAMVSLIFVGAWKYFPFVVIAVLARLQTIPVELYEASKIDGAGSFARFRDITLPQLREVDLIYLLTGGGPVISTQTLPLLVYKEAFALNQMGAASAVAVLMMLFMLVFMFIYLRRAGVQGRG